MNRMVFDTETTDLSKPFCYDVGYLIFNDESNEILMEKHFVVEQVWHNLPLFESAYYKDKRPLYVTLMRAKKATMTKWGYIMQEMIRDIKAYEVNDAYAYNSDFDEKVFNFNCDWFKTMNPFDNVAIHDIWGYVSQFISCNDDYKAFCEQNELFTETGNYKASAEAVFRFLNQTNDFDEEHMGMYDAEIEAFILTECVKRGAEYDKDYKVIKVLPRMNQKPFTIKINGTVIYDGKYIKKYVRQDVYNFTVMGE